jgi:phage gp36-like protein
MAYATEQDLVDRLGSEAKLAVLLADEEGDEIEGRLDAAIAAAGEEIDEALGGFYTVPFSPIPATVTRWAADLALESLAERGGGPGNVATRAARARQEIAAVGGAKRGISGATRKAAVGGVDEATPRVGEGDLDPW